MEKDGKLTEEVITMFHKKGITKILCGLYKRFTNH